MLPNTINSPTSADLNRKSIIELAVYVYETAIAAGGNAEAAQTEMLQFIALAEAAAGRAETAELNAEHHATTAEEEAAAARIADGNAEAAAARALLSAQNAEQWANQIAPWATLNVGSLSGLQSNPATIQFPAGRSLIIVPMVIDTAARTPYLAQPLIVPVSLIDGSAFYGMVNIGGAVIMMTIRTDLDVRENVNAATISAETGVDGLNVRAIVYAGGGYN